MELFIGAIVSAIVQYVKVFFADHKHADLETLGTLIILSLLGGFGLWWIQALGFWNSALGILTFASAIWALFIRPFETK